jgi:hypothetical protein
VDFRCFHPELISHWAACRRTCEAHGVEMGVRARGLQGIVRAVSRCGSCLTATSVGLTDLFPDGEPQQTPGYREMDEWRNHEQGQDAVEDGEKGDGAETEEGGEEGDERERHRKSREIGSLLLSLMQPRGVRKSKPTENKVQ